MNIDRKTASEINPLISSLWTTDTLDSLSHLIIDLGYFLSQVDNPPPGTELHFGRIYLIYNAISASLDYETQNIKSITPAQKVTRDV